MRLTPWYKVVNPRQDLREGRPLDAAEFAVHLDQIRDRRAPEVYQNPEAFFERTYLTQGLTEMAAQVLRRLSGISTGTSAVYNLATQFGGGKTHALTMLYHLARGGPVANGWSGVHRVLTAAGLASAPEARTAVFVGTEFDSLRGRGGNDGTPLRLSPWGEIAFQLGGEQAFAVVAEHDRAFIEPKGDVVRDLLPKDKPCLILMDEIINYASTYRRKGYNNALYNFIHVLAETVRGLDNVVLVVSIPASELEYTADDEADEQRFRKMLDRVGKPMLMSAETETSEIIRRRLFEWGGLPREGQRTAVEYARWVLDHRHQLPNWFPVDSAREAFEATYPFHPSAISVFERKWQGLPRFQRTRGILRLLAMWASRAYQQGYKQVQGDPLIGLGCAPLDDPQFRAAIFEQLGEGRLEVAVTSDIDGHDGSFAVRLDADASAAIRKARLHRQVATTIFFESNGGTAQHYATLPEIRLAVAEPGLDTGNVEITLEALISSCYYLRAEGNHYRFSHRTNLNRLLADRRAVIKVENVDERIRADIQRAFVASTSLPPLFFPERSGLIPDHAALALVVLAPEHNLQDRKGCEALMEAMTREHGTSSRTFKSALIFAVAEAQGPLRDEARTRLAWEEIRDEQGQLGLDEGQQKQVAENLSKAGRDLKEAIWRTYKNLFLLGKDNVLHLVDLGLVHSSAAPSLTALIIGRLRQDGDIEDAISPNFLLRNWPPAFREWSTRAVRDAFYASPQFPRLLDGQVLKDTVARGVSNGFLGYVGKTADGGYSPFHFEKPLGALAVEISEEMYIITKETAEAYRDRQKREPASVAIAPEHVRLRPGERQTFVATVFDKDQREMAGQAIHWSTTGGSIDEQGVFTAGKGEGELRVTAMCCGYTADALVTVKDGVIPSPPPPPPPVRVTRMSWTGAIPALKWMNFYMKVLTRFVQGGGLRITLGFEVTSQDGIPPQAIDETRAALRELGLEDNVHTE